MRTRAGGYTSRMAPREKQTKIADAPATSDRAEKFYMENTLLRVSGALFCHDAKLASTRSKKIELNRGDPDKRIVIEPHPNYGQPGPLAHKIFVSLIKKHSDYGRPVPDEVSFSKREIMSLVGRKEWGGRDSLQLSRAIDEIATTYVRAFFKNQKGKFYENRFNIFSRVLIERKNSHSDPIEACTITLAEPIVSSLRDEHFTCLNHFLMKQLGTIGQALYMRLFFHFANLYEEQTKKRLAFPKRYDDICTEWLGGLKILTYKSHILKDQLGPHLTQLINVGFLSSFSIDKAKTRPGFVITFRPGPAFFQDYERFYRHRNQGELQWNFQADRQVVAEPLRVAHLFTAKRTKQDVKQITFATSSDVESARQLLTHVSFEEAPGLPRLRARPGRLDPVRRADPRRPEAVHPRLPRQPRVTRPRQGAGGDRRPREGAGGAPNRLRSFPSRSGSRPLCAPPRGRARHHRRRGPPDIDRLRGVARRPDARHP